MLFKIIFLRSLQIPQKSTSESSLIKLQALRTPTLLKRDSSIGFFLRNLLNV